MHANSSVIECFNFHLRLTRANAMYKSNMYGLMPERNKHFKRWSCIFVKHISMYKLGRKPTYVMQCKLMLI